MDYFTDLNATVAKALAEDIGTGDITAQLIDDATIAKASVLTRQTAVVCGQPWVNEVVRQVDPDVTVTWLVEEGDQVEANTILFYMEGKARSLLTAERTALNFLQLLSGTATQTRHYVALIDGSQSTLLDTRKTIPGLRLAQKYAVTVGGANNHRIGLFDAFLIKENHIDAAGSINLAIERARTLAPDRRLEVEVETLDQFQEAIAAKPDWIMLDNFSNDDMREAVHIATGTGIKLEASGGIDTEEKLKKIAATGVDYISVGALTKHSEAIDLSMTLE